MTEMRQEDDTNNDGTIDSLSIQTSNYDNNGRNVLDVSTSNGVVTLTTQSTYDSNGKIQTIRTEQDVDRNGIMDDLTIDTYDASGQLASSEEFSDYNGQMLMATVAWIVESDRFITPWGKEYSEREITTQMVLLISERFSPTMVTAI